MLNRHPLLTIMFAAIVLRLLAVFFAQGYMAHDDHFETVEIAWSWHHEGMFLDNGTLRWEGKPDYGVLRSAVYNMFMLGLMKATAWFGVEQLNTHMYFNRLVHALLSLLPVIFGYRYLKEETNERTALIGGLMLAGYFLMPYLAVRNLTEVVAANLLLPGLYYAHRSLKNELAWRQGAVVAGVLCGLAIMIRYQAAAAVVAVPVAMLLTNRRWRIPLVFCVTLGVILMIQACLDIYTHGYFWGSFRNMVGNLGEPTIPGPWYRYILLLFGIMIPPFSLVFIGSMFSIEVLKRHLVLIGALVSFVVIHSFIAEKQERFMATILPMLIVAGMVGMYELVRQSCWFANAKKLRVGLWTWFLAVNLVGLAVFTFNFGKRGAIEPMVYLSRQPDADRILIDATERRLFIPYSYWNYDRSEAVPLFGAADIDSAIAQGRLDPKNPPQYAVIFTDSKLDQHLGILRDKLGDYEVVFHGEPSLVDALANKLNPKYNRRNESWVVKLAN